jgi:branched-chain amino acid transport system substrate-binding protein
MLGSSAKRGVLALVLALGAGTAGAQETLKIGVINPFSGPLAQYGEEVARGYQIATDEQNAKGGVLGKKIELVRGDAGTPQQAIAAVQRLQDAGVAAFIGTYISAVSSAASDAAAQFNKTYWDTNALAQELTERGLPNFIRSGPDAALFAEVAAKTVIDLVAPELKKSPKDLRVYIEHEDSIYGTSIADHEVQVLKAAGVQVTGVGAHSYRAIDLTDSILRAKGTNPDVWMSTSYQPDGLLLLRTMRDQGFVPAAIVSIGAGDTPDAIKALGTTWLNGLLIVSYPSPEQNQAYGPGGQEFLATYRKNYGRDPLIPQPLSSYVGAKIFFETIAAAGSTDPEKMRAAAAKMDKPVGSYASGFGVKFDSTMQNVLALPTVEQWQSGKLLTVYPVAARLPGTTVTGLPRK